MIVEFLEVYEKNLKEGRPIPSSVPEELRKPVAVGQIRELWTVPVERFVVLGEEAGLWLTVPLTNMVMLLPKDGLFYALKRQGLVLGVLPTWDYLRSELVEKYSRVIGRLTPAEVERVKSYVRNTKREDLPWHTRRLIRLNSKLWANLTLFSMLAHAHEQEEEKEV